MNKRDRRELKLKIMNIVKPALKVNDRVSYTETIKGKKIVRKGEVIEFNHPEGDWPDIARIKWDESKIRTWIRISALAKL